MRGGGGIPARIAAVVLALSAVLLRDVPARGGEDYEPKRCAAAVGYVGAPLHAPLDTALFSGLDGAITVDHLLTHTSGAFSFDADLRFRRKKGSTAPDELIRIAARHGNAACPG